MPCCRCTPGHGWAGTGRGQGGRVGRETLGGSPPTPACLQAVLKRGLKPSCTIVPLMRRDHKNNLEFFLTNIGKLHLAG